MVEGQCASRSQGYADYNSTQSDYGQNPSIDSSGETSNEFLEGRREVIFSSALLVNEILSSFKGPLPIHTWLLHFSEALEFQQTGLTKGKQRKRDTPNDV